MRTSDFVAIGVILAVLALFPIIPGLYDGFTFLTRQYPYAMSFIKFALLSTFGECVGLRITEGVYNRPGFGVLPRALVWGLLGMGIKLAFTVFVTGVPNALAELGLVLPPAEARTFLWRLLAAFSISVSLNCIFAPVFMTLHRVTDAHITVTGGTLRGFCTPIDMVRHLSEINWTSMWGFVLKKTIPLFWIPAHTITFLLPSHFQVLFAAVLGIVLGLILSVARRRSFS